jgi:hypothetical protein
MKHSRLVLAAVATLTLGTWATIAFACEGKSKTTAAAASSKSSACTAEMAAKCTPEMAAACKAKGATAASMAGCAHGATSATTAAHGAAGGCGAKGATATTAAQSGTRSVDAVLAGAGGSCSGHGATKTTSAVTAGAGGSCSGHSAKSSTAQKHGDCDACADMAFCDGEVGSMGATVQVVPLKNGVMYVYTANDANKVHAVQASMEHRNERMTGMLAAGDKAKLCPSCKSVRGAIASGKLSREFVNIEGGCLTLMTSNDPATVAKIYSLAGIKGPMSIKS